MNQKTTPTSSSSINNNRRNLSIVIAIVLVVVVALTLYFALGSANKKTDDTKTNTNNSQATESTSDSKMLTGTLPNGKTVTYPDTEGNRNISWSNSEKGADYVSLSHKGIDKLLSAVDPEIIVKLCGANGELAQKNDIVVATMSTVSRSVEYSTDDNCLDELATYRNADAKSRDEARVLVKTVTNDIQDFYRKVVIK